MAVGAVEAQFYQRLLEAVGLAGEDLPGQHEHVVARRVVAELNGIVQPAPAPRFSRSDPGTPAPPPSRPIDDAQTIIAEWSEQQANGA